MPLKPGFRFSAAARRIKEFGGQGGLPRGEDCEFFPHFHRSPDKLGASAD